MIFILFIVTIICNHNDDNHYDREKIMSLSQEEILRDINTRNISGVLLREKNFTNLLGEIEYSETGDRFPQSSCQNHDDDDSLRTNNWS